MSATKAERWNKIRTPQQVNDTSKLSKEQILDSLTQPVPSKNGDEEEQPSATSAASDSQIDEILPTTPEHQDHTSTASMPANATTKKTGEATELDSSSPIPNGTLANSETTQPPESDDGLELNGNSGDESNSGTNTMFTPEILAKFEELFKGVYHGAPDSDLLVEEAYTRITFLIENELIQEFDKIASTERRGFIKQIVNTSLRIGLDMYTEWKSQQPEKPTKKTTPRPRRRGVR